MRRGYWSGFLMGGLFGMMAFRAYGDELMDWMHVKMGLDAEDSPRKGGKTAFRPKRLRRRAW